MNKLAVFVILIVLAALLINTLDKYDISISDIISGKAIRGGKTVVVDRNLGILISWGLSNIEIKRILEEQRTADPGLALIRAARNNLQNKADVYD